MINLEYRTSFVTMTGQLSFPCALVQKSNVLISTSTQAVTMSAIIYCLRCLVGHDIPLNQVVDICHVLVVLVRIFRSEVPPQIMLTVFSEVLSYLKVSSFSVKGLKALFKSISAFEHWITLQKERLKCSVFSFFQTRNHIRSMCCLDSSSGSFPH